VLLAVLAAGVGYDLALWTVIARTARAREDERLRNVPVGLSVTRPGIRDTEPWDPGHRAGEVAGARSPTPWKELPR
jgi:hypothetical protein